MPVNLPPGFSVYNLVQRVQEQSTVMFNRQTMTDISHELEDVTLKDGAQTRIFSGFQYMSNFKRQIKRYERLAARAESVYVFGVPDVEMPAIDNLTYINLPKQHQLAREWFLVSYSKSFASVLATEETSPAGAPDDQRVFKGVWSFDVSLTDVIEEWLSNIVDARELLISEDEHNARAQRALIRNMMDRMSGRIAARQRQHADDTQEQLRIIVENTLQPLGGRA